jgi:conjugal transfer pilin signal peptidase TrbI
MRTFKMTAQIKDRIFTNRGLGFLALILAGAILFSLLFFLVAPRIVVAVTPSVNYRIFFIETFDKRTIVKHDYILFNKPGYDRPFVKQVLCMAGDYLYNIDNDYFCNGSFIGSSKDFSLTGKTLSRFSYRGVIPREKLFVSGSHKDSYDSRYFGFIDISEVCARVKPIV